MTKPEQRVAIAKAWGWTHFEPDTIQYLARRADGKWDVIPDCPNDLNAVAEVFSTLPYPTQENVVERLVMAKPSDYPEMAVAYSTAEDWCEAILKELKLWREDSEPNNENPQKTQ